MKHLKKALLGTATALLLGSSASAASYDFEFEVWGFDYGTVNYGWSYGTISWDDAALISLGGTGDLSGSDISISVSFGSETYTNANDVDFPAYPLLAFSNGSLTNINYILVDGVNGVTNIGSTFFGGYVGLDFNGGLEAVNDSTGVITAAATLQPLPAVPLPAGLPLVASALGAFAVLRRKKRSA